MPAPAALQRTDDDPPAPPSAPEPPRQHASHRQLLHRVPAVPTSADVHAIIVPAARPASSLEHAVRLAAELGCPLLVLCSYDARTDEVLARTAGRGVTVLAVDSPPASPLPPLRTRELLAEGPFRRRTDTSGKRNFGLALAWMAGWQNILFLDDDIQITDAAEVRRAAALLGTYQVVGLDNTGFADNSVVCHAHRDTGGRQGTFIGAGAMLFRGSRATSFFPHIYNEDWFFLLDEERITACAVHGTFSQERFDPYVMKDRAKTQEFGDCLAEGLFALLDDHKTLDAAGSTAFWSDFLADRDRFISSILRRLDAAPGTSVIRRMQMAEALWAARASLQQITPERCVEYLTAWHADQRTWRAWIEGLPQGLPVEKALLHLGVD
jgi:glycosyltransferase involved in cell wall biosynthesis